jgi:hypothetical protein
MSTRTEEELADAINNGDDTIEIEGDLKNKIIKIKATGQVAWVIAIGAIGAAVLAIVVIPPIPIPPVIAAKGVMAASAAPVAVGVLGLPATIAAVTIAIASGGIGVLNKLRDYDIIEKNDSKLVLKKK